MGIMVFTKAKITDSFAVRVKYGYYTFVGVIKTVNIE